MNNPNSRVCSIYRCSKKEGMYLYVDKEVDWEELPEGLHQHIGTTELAMTLLISRDKKLARANAAEVLTAITEKGFYLQMPPSLYGSTQQGVNNEMNVIRENNSKL